MKLQELHEANSPYKLQRRFDNLTLFIDFADPEEREASLFGKVKTAAELTAMINTHKKEIEAVLRNFSVSLQDAKPIGEPESERGGVALYLEFPPAEYDDGQYGEWNPHRDPTEDEDD